MPPIIRRTVTITIMETWTITWPDGHETSWDETPKITHSALGESGERLPPITDDNESEDGVLDLDGADPTVADD